MYKPESAKKNNTIITCGHVFASYHQAEEKALEDTNEVPDGIKKLATKAKEACERLLKDGSKLVSNSDFQKEEGRLQDPHQQHHEPEQLADVQRVARQSFD